MIYDLLGCLIIMIFILRMIIGNFFQVVCGFLIFLQNMLRPPP